MAEARYKKLWKFLNNSNYEYAADIGSDMRCIICTSILINAHNSVCGCRYCLECVKAYLNGERRFCPGNTDDCKVEQLDIDSNIYPDHTINNRISKLKVSCRYSCGYRCELRIIEEHERACLASSLESTDILLVSNRLNKHNLEKHQCQDKVGLRSEIAKMRLAREIDEARARETNELVDQIKQEVANLRNEINMTKKQSSYLVVYIVFFFLCLLIICGDVKKYSFSANVTNEELHELRTRINLLATKVGQFEQEMRIKNDDLHRNISEMLKKLAIQFDSMERRVPNIEIEVAMQNQTKFDRPVQNIETKVAMQNQNEFVWHIRGWTMKTKSARNGMYESIFSDAFYSHKNGYRMCLSVYPNGHGVGTGTHFSVFFHIMPGPFDTILSWPFKHTVELSLIDQHTGLNYISSVIRQEHFPNDIGWNKPPTDRSHGFGDAKLIELSTLSRNPKLCQNDQIFIRCVVK